MEKDFVIVSPKVGEFLYGKDFSSAKNAISVLAAVHAAERAEENPLVLEDFEYDQLLEAVYRKDFLVDTGQYYVNVGKPVGREEYLSISDVQYDEEGKRIYSWDFEGLHNAKLFTREELDTVVPEAYRREEYFVMENVAKRQSGWV